MFEREQEHLVMARRHIVQAQDRVDRQRDLVQRLEGHGQSAELARDLLASFTATLGQMRLHLDYLEHECAGLGGTTGLG